jgi:hypothetical protein
VEARIEAQADEVVAALERRPQDLLQVGAWRGQSRAGRAWEESKRQASEAGGHHSSGCGWCGCLGGGGCSDYWLPLRPLYQELQ